MRVPRETCPFCGSRDVETDAGREIIHCHSCESVAGGAAFWKDVHEKDGLIVHRE